MPVIHAGGQNQDRRRCASHDLLDCLLALAVPQVEVEDDDVGMRLRDAFDRIGGGGRLSHHDDVTPAVQYLHQLAQLC
jgi:hypothetical protein